MKKHHLWGRKTPGPYTKAGNEIFDRTADAAGAVGRAAGTGLGVGASAAGAAGSMLGGAGNSMIEGTKDFNHWAQENHARLHLQDEED